DYYCAAWDKSLNSYFF
nr:immunoglobulin light chain junction region [Macaca mulatta]MOV94663.1 immunoglobulin light chain junction region [Macaca mulatta]MOV96366.1 immunoglobulin light chain junction region [Macaca mulatta]MOV96419.1 immunoglobulin light chain junction region [Macaca mulatta]MOV96779.1 immunoglobulin light chain junction region [Macaca mulatta]